jgi:hypothetical protein
MTVTIAKIRNLIDISETSELADSVIQENLDDATTYVNGTKNPSAPLDMVELGIKHLAAYWSYQTYSDRIRHELTGSFDTSGQFNPIQKSYDRETRAKLDSLEKKAEISLSKICKQIESIPFAGTIR